jgi:DNA-binding NtrC family response regulator
MTTMTESQTSQTENKKSILIVDDEPGIINAVRRELSSVVFAHQALDIEGYTNPLEALERAANKPFDLVISDYRMPEMDGLSFLKAFAQLQPNCARLVLSGQTDFNSLAKMINETHIYRFIPKPWTEYFLKSSILQALRLREAVLENRRLADIIRTHGLASSADFATQGKDRILIVDDDINVLNALSRDLSYHSNFDDLFSIIRSDLTSHQPTRLDTDRISVQTCSSPSQALKMADEVTFSCIISDFRMPEMDGIALLQAFAEKQPDCERILISGEASTVNLVNALDLAHIFSYIGKPWVDFEVKSSLAQALEHRRITIENRVLAEMLRAKDIDLLT